jgi:hypothetical protein
MLAGEPPCQAAGALLGPAGASPNVSQLCFCFAAHSVIIILLSVLKVLCFGKDLRLQSAIDLLLRAGRLLVCCVS